MANKRRSKFSSILSAVLFSTLSLILLAGIGILIKQKTDSSKAIPDSLTPPVSVSISEDPVVPEPIIYTNEAATYVSKQKSIASMLCYNADGSLRNEYRYDEFGRLLYFYSHSSESRTEISYTEEYEILSTYTNGKYFGDEYYDLNHNLIFFKNYKNGYEYSYEYDANGNMLSESYTTDAGATRQTLYTYNPDNTVASVSCTLNEVRTSYSEYTYDKGLLIKEFTSTPVAGSDCSDYETFYSYDSENRLISTKKYRANQDYISSDPVQWVENTYDGFGRLVKLEKTCDSEARIYCEEYEFDANGLSAVCRYSYKNALTGETDTLFDYGYIIYCYDKVGNTTLKETHPSKGEVIKESFSYEYDSDYCIIRQVNSFNGTVSSSYEYHYYD